MNTWNTPPTPTQAKAFLGVSNINVIFSFNPDEVKWSYKNNTVSRDTIGGRVVQILSASVEAMTVIGRTGSRDRLQTFAKGLKDLMQYHIKTGEPVNFKVPSRNWNFLVYVQNISGLGWDVTSTSYPYQLTLTIQEDLNNIINLEIQKDSFNKLVAGMGYNPDFHGGSSAEALQYIEGMKTALSYVNIGSSAADSSYDSPLPGGKYKEVDTGEGGNATLTKALLAKANLRNVPQITIKSDFTITLKEVYALAYWALNEMGDLSGTELKNEAIMATAISYCETRAHDTRAHNPEATNGHAYGLWQMNDRYGTSLYDPIVAALLMAQKYYASKWLYWGCGPTNPNGNGGYAQWMDEARNAAL